ncbi:hypothetical protein SAMN05421736_10477 [Evansella caseinilytica]|uniref:Tetratricopeptide repeat protein n=1 Tax=Evansella caseinilytica TaxID=1503961 RepID=A0A1H3NIM0_9BACI|nr:tetratricopeptide repeat protein [Evansella caseinilytica]SDY88285.1 hypothetical protein SAMN05421736_10477 [Evansella caseinilytica]
MFNAGSWNSLYTWLVENHHQLTEREKSYWMEYLAEQNQKVLELWSERLELLDEVKEKLMAKAPLLFKTGDENLRGIQYFHLGLYDKAIETLLQEIDASQQPTRIYLYLGYSFLYLNKGEQTNEYFLNVVHRSLDPLEKHFAFLGLGLHAGRNDKIEQAIIYLEKAESLLFNTDVVYNLGICYLLLEMPSHALSYFAKVIQSGEGDGETYYWLGKCYLDSGNRTQGMETWYQAIRQFESSELLRSLAMEFEEKEIFPCAVYCYERLKDLGDDTLPVIHGLAWNYGLMDEREKSLQCFHELFTEEKQEINFWISYLWLLDKWKEETLLNEAIAEINKLNLSHPLLKKAVSEAGNK